MVEPRFGNLQRNHSCSTLSGSVPRARLTPGGATCHPGLFTLVPSGDLLERTPPVSSDSTMTSSSYFRLMAFWSIAFLGSTAIGGPLVGWLAELGDPRWGLAVGGFAALAASAWGFVTLRHLKSSAPESAAALSAAGPVRTAESSNSPSSAHSGR